MNFLTPRFARQDQQDPFRAERFRVEQDSCLVSQGSRMYLALAFFLLHVLKSVQSTATT